MRFVANLGNWDESIMLIAGGQSGQPGSAHYTDSFPYWYEAARSISRLAMWRKPVLASTP